MRKDEGKNVETVLKFMKEFEEAKLALDEGGTLAEWGFVFWDEGWKLLDFLPDWFDGEGDDEVGVEVMEAAAMEEGVDKIFGKNHEPSLLKSSAGAS